MTNTMLRILSAAVMILILAIFVWLGQGYLTYLVLTLGVILVDEILVNLLGVSRKTLSYASAQLLLIGLAMFFTVLDHSGNFIALFNNAALMNNFFLLVYLFYVKMDNKILLNIVKKIPYLAGIYIFLPIVSLSFLINHSEWKALLLVLLLVNFGMDTGAWLVGKNFGKHKLWPLVSPNKTIEGLIGGIVIAGLVASIGWYYAFGHIDILSFIIFAMLGMFSQLGDLVQSKLKRQCEIKDSSRLIPGHGGVYDRLDSLIFVTPFYILVLQYLAK